MPIKIAINGFGRIGRSSFKAALQNRNVEVVAINDIMDTKTLAHLLKYDSVVRPMKDAVAVNGKKYITTSEKDPVNLPWKKLDVQVVLECTGKFTNKKDASAHIKAGAKRVVISAPTKDNSTQTLVFGTKETANCFLKGKCDVVLSNASCTTNCIAPVIQILVNRFGVEKALMTTIHAYTAGQNLVDGPHKDLRRARSGAMNIVPTSTGAAVATTNVVKELQNVFDGISVRVPVPSGSLCDITCVLARRRVTVKQINDEFAKASKTPLFKNIVAVNNKPNHILKGALKFWYP